MGKQPPCKRSSAIDLEFGVRDAPLGAVCSLVVTPKAGRTELIGGAGSSISIRVAAPPADGAANDAMIRFLADIVGISRSRLSVVSGASSRRKRVLFKDMTGSELVKRLRERTGEVESA